MTVAELIERLQEFPGHLEASLFVSSGRAESLDSVDRVADKDPWYDEEARQFVALTSTYTDVVVGPDYYDDQGFKLFTPGGEEVSPSYTHLLREKLNATDGDVYREIDPHQDVVVARKMIVNRGPGLIDRLMTAANEAYYSDEVAAGVGVPTLLLPSAVYHDLNNEIVAGAMLHVTSTGGPLSMFSGFHVVSIPRLHHPWLGRRAA